MTTAAPRRPGAAPKRSLLARAASATALVVATTVSAGITSWLIGSAAKSVSGRRTEPWIIGRAAGVTSYLLLVSLVLVGLALSHPWRTRLRRPNAVNRIRLHVALTIFTLAFVVLHIVVLATDEYAGVGWRGALLPLGSTYRPVPVTLGVIGLWSGLLAGGTAALAGHLPRRVWWPIHKVAALALAAVWAHGMFAGGDAMALRSLYVITGALVVIVAVSRYVARTPADRVGQLAQPRALAEARRTR